jgi:pyruvate formate lyase activating enzyme
MNIGGFQKFSLIDYPNKMAAVIFTQGCQFRCPFCYNPELVLPDRFSAAIPENKILTFLKTRKGKLDGIVLTGGEPTVDPDLSNFVSKVKTLGFAVKLDTNGSQPHVLINLLRAHRINYIAMDIKGPLKRYPQLVGTPCDIQAIKESIDIVIDSGVDHEFRSTIAKDVFTDENLTAMANLVKRGKRYRIKTFIPADKLVDRAWALHTGYSENEIQNIQMKYGWGI